MRHPRITLWTVFAILLFSFSTNAAEAATMRLSPDTGVYSSGGTFSVHVILNTAGKPVNAAEGVISFNPRELTVVSATRGGSIFNLWTQEPTFSNTAGTISFGGGSPTGYTGSTGEIMSVVFRAPSASVSKVTFSSGSVLAADGQGTNVLTNMTGGTYTITAQTFVPEQEPVYVPPANTPKKPVVTSDTHTDEQSWYQNTTAHLAWALPAGVTSVRTLLDEISSSIPSKVYDSPIRDITLDELPQGVSYFHIQFRNSDGWGGVTHYRLSVDTEKPSAFTISEAGELDPANPVRQLHFDVTDLSPVKKYIVQLDGGEPIEFIDADGEGRYTLPTLVPGRHTVIVEAFDSAGNSLINTYSFDVASFEKPVFTEYPTRLNSEVIPVFRGSTRPHATLTITIVRGGVVEQHQVTSDESGNFNFIPDTPFDLGVYDMSAVSVDTYGAQSDPSETIRFIVEEPGYLRIGTFVVSVLSILVPLFALLILLVFGLWYVWHRLLSWRRRIIKETKEAEYRLAVEFDAITSHLGAQVEKLTKSRKGKLTKAETALIDELKKDIEIARSRINKEISDIDDVVE